MKIIQHGLHYDEAITVQCRECKCIYYIESYQDWQGRWLNNLLTGQKCYEYSIHCPECGAMENFSCCPYEHGNQGFASWNPIFDRKDWKERYSINNL